MGGAPPSRRWFQPTADLSDGDRHGRVIMGRALPGAGSGLVGGAERVRSAEVADLPPGRALDLAAGEGRNAIWLAERGWQVDALDFSEVALSKARQISERRGVD